MALLSQIFCLKCKQNKSVLHSASQVAPDICEDCAQKQEEDAKAFRLYKLSKLTVEERLSIIEEYIDDLGEHLRNSNNKFSMNDMIG